MVMKKNTAKNLLVGAGVGLALLAGLWMDHLANPAQAAPERTDESASANESVPQPDYFSGYLIDNAREALKNRYFAQAAGFVERALENQPNNPDFLRLIIEIRQNQGNWPEAERRLSQLLAIEPDNINAVADRGLVRWHQGLLTEAGDDLELASRNTALSEPRKDEVLKALAEAKAGRGPVNDKQIEAPLNYSLLRKDWTMVSIMEEKGDWAGLEEFYTRVIRHYPQDSGYAYISRGYARLSMNQPDAAKNDFLKALSFENLTIEHRETATQALADIEASRHQADELEKVMAETARKSELWAKWQHRLIELEEIKDWVGLENLYNQALRDQPDAASILLGRGYARLAQRRFDTAEADFVKARKVDVDSRFDTETEAALAEVTRQRKEAEELARAQSAGTDSYGEKTRGGETGLWASGNQRAWGVNVWPKFELIEKQLEAGRTDQAMATLETLSSLTLRGEELGMRNYYWGETLWAEKRWDQAYPYFVQADELLTEKYRRSNALWRMAEYSQRNGEPDQAAEYARESTALLPDQYWRVSQAGHFFSGLSRNQEAADYLERSLSLHTPSDEEIGVYLNLAGIYQILREKDKYVHYLERYIDRATDKITRQGAGTKSEVEELFNARRSHSYLNRVVGLDSYIFSSYYKNGDYSVSMVNELYGQFQTLNGVIFRPYLQINGNLASSYSGTYYEPWSATRANWSGASHLNNSAYGIAGLKVYPLQGQGLALGLERVFKIGDDTQNETRARLSYFWAHGFDLEPYEPDWNYALFFGEAIYSVKDEDTIAYGELRGGHSFRVDILDDTFVITPYAGPVWGYGGQDVNKGERWSLEAGPGISFRKWYRQDKYNAPQSTFDIAVQYRWGISHNRGDVLSLTFSNSF